MNDVAWKSLGKVTAHSGGEGALRRTGTSWGIYEDQRRSGRILTKLNLRELPECSLRR